MHKKIRLQPILPQNKKQNMFNHWGAGGGGFDSHDI